MVDCEVENILFPMGYCGIWRFRALVILKLNSAHDVEKALAKNGHSIGKDSVIGCYSVRVNS